MRVKNVILTVMLFFFSTFSFPQWERNAQHKGNITAVAVSPSYDAVANPTLFIAVEGKGVFKTTDKGANWTLFNNGLDSLNVTCLAFSPNGAVLFAGTKDQGVYRSLDGADWVSARTGLKNLHITSLAISPDFLKDNTLFAGTYGDGVYVSSAGGAEWTPAGGGSAYILSLAISPYYASKPTIFSGTDGNGIFVSYNGGTNWEPSGSGLPDGSAVRTLATSPAFQQLDGFVFAGLSDSSTGELGFYVSDDEGKSWLQKCDLTKFKEVWSLAVSPQFSVSDDYVFVGSKSGLFLYSVKGDCPEVPEFPLSVSWILAQGISPNFNDKDKDIFPGLWDGGLRFSNDGGVTSREIYTSPLNINACSIAISPSFHVADEVIFSVTNDRGIMRSLNGGISWTSLNDYEYKGDPDGFLSIAVSSEFKPGVSGTIFAGASGRGIFMSTDGGNSWTPQNGVPEKQLPPGATITVIQMSQEFYNDGIVFAGTKQYGLFLSSDQGNTWVHLSNLPLTSITSLEISPDFPAKPFLFASGETAGVIYISSDGGNSWQQSVVDSKNYPAILSIAVSPLLLKDGTIFAGAEGDYGVYRSTDMGDSWSSVNGTGFPTKGLLGTKALAISPGYGSDSDTLYAGTGALGIFVSDNASNQEVVIWNDYNNSIGDKHINSIALSPQYTKDNGFLIAGTVSGGIFFSYSKENIWNSTANNTSLTDKIYDTAIHPDNEGTIMIATPQGVFISYNGGETYIPFNDGILDKGEISLSVLSVAFVKDKNGNIYPFAGTSSGSIFRRNSMSEPWYMVYGGSLPITEFSLSDFDIYASTGGTGVLKSQDIGLTWKFYNNGLPTMNINDIHGLPPAKTVDSRDAVIGIDPALSNSPKSCCAGTVWVGTGGDGVALSKDGGDSWTTTNSCSLGEDLSSANCQAVLATSSGWSLTGTDGKESAGFGLYRTNDADSTCWIRSNYGLEATSLDIRDLTEAENGDILCGIYGTDNGGVFLSSDGGEHWYKINSGFDPVSYSVEDVITSKSGTYYAGKSSDGSWSTTVKTATSPTISGLDVTSGTTKGDTLVQITGSSFQDGAIIEFGNIDVLTTYVNSSTLVCKTPAHPSGWVDVSVRNPDTQTAVLINGFRFTDPDGASLIIIELTKSGSDVVLTWKADGTGNYKIYRDSISSFDGLFLKTWDTSLTNFKDGEGLSGSNMWFYKVE